MFKTFVAVAIAALALGAADPMGARAQDLGPSNPQTGSSQESLSARDAQARSERSQGSRLTREDRRGRRERGAPPAAPTPEQVRADAQALLTAAGNPCQVTDAVLMGQNAELQNIFEAACAAGPGQIIIASTPPTLFDCVVLASSAVTARELDPAAEPQRTCALPGNQDTLSIITAYARDAGIRCEVDEAIVAGRANDGAVIYEIGCASADGFWLRKPSAGAAVVTECLEIISQNGRCRYTTPAEQAQSMKTRLAGSEIAECDVQQARYMGANANGRFYEVKCAVGDGYIARIGEEGVRQVYACAIAQPIGGGCTLSSTPAAAAPTGGRA